MAPSLKERPKRRLNLEIVSTVQRDSQDGHRLDLDRLCRPGSPPPSPKTRKCEQHRSNDAKRQARKGNGKKE